MSCQMGAGQFTQRLQYRTYQGQPSSVLGGSTQEYAFVNSDVVPPDKFWAVYFASLIILNGAGTAVNRAGLWLMWPGKAPGGGGPGSNLAAYAAYPSVFQGNIAGSIVNGPPVGPAGIRVDELNDGLSSDEYSKQAERVMVRARKLLVPSGCVLMGYGGAYGTSFGGNVGEQFQLQLAFVEFQNSENPEVIF